MRRGISGIALATTMVLLALLLPASASAAYPYTTTVEANACTATGGLNGYGYVRLKVLQKEWGTSGTNYFQVRIQVQRRLRAGTTWTVVDSMTNITESFPNDANSISWEQARKYSFTLAQVTNYAHRIAMRFQWWDMRAGLTLSRRRSTAKVCQGSALVPALGCDRQLRHRTGRPSLLPECGNARLRLVAKLWRRKRSPGSLRGNCGTPLGVTATRAEVDHTEGRPSCRATAGHCSLC
jgi:hypothetical protein